MPVQKTKSKLLAKLGDKVVKAHAAHKDDDVSYGNMDLPAGIEGGVAQLCDCRFGEYEKGPNKGKLYFYAAGIVKTPAEHAGVKIAGLRTQIMEPLCDTPTRSRTTVDEHYAWILNELKKLAGPDALADVGADEIEDFVAQLKEAGPHFRFRTWIGEATAQFPNPRVNHQWAAACDEPDGDGGESVVEEEAATEEAEAKAEPEAEAEEKVEGDDLDAVAELADSGNEDAATQLTEKAKEVGISTKKIEGADNWAAVVAMIREASPDEEAPAEEEATAEEEPEEAIPEKGGTYTYQPNDPKTKKPMVNPKTKKPVKYSVEVTKVDAKAKTVTLKNLDDGKTVYAGVPFDKLQDA